MRISLREIKAIEQYLLQKGPMPDRLLTEAYLQLDTELEHNLKAQQKAYAVIKQYGREKLMQEIRQTEKKLFSENRFRNFQAVIRAIFK